MSSEADMQALDGLPIAPPPLRDARPHDAQPFKRWLRHTARPDSVTQLEEIELVEALQAEVVLLREENARLKAAAYHKPSLGRLLERARALPAIGASREDLSDSAAELLVEGLVMRESLLEVCREITASLAAVEDKLTALGPPDDTGSLAP